MHAVPAGRRCDCREARRGDEPAQKSSISMVTVHQLLKMDIMGPESGLKLPEDAS